MSITPRYKQIDPNDWSQLNDSLKDIQFRIPDVREVGLAPTGEAPVGTFRLVENDVTGVKATWVRYKSGWHRLDAVQSVSDIYVAMVGSISQMGISFNSTSVVNVLSGVCRNSTNTFTIVNSSTLTASLAVSGVGGLDTGAEAANRFYAVYIIASSTGAYPNAALLSLSATAPTLPPGYNVFRRMGFVRNNAASNIISFVQHGIDRNRFYWYNEAGANLRVLSAANSAAFVSLSLSTFIPTTMRVCALNLLFDANSATGASVFDLGFTLGGAADHSFSPGVRLGVAGLFKVTHRMPCPPSGFGTPTIYWRTPTAGDALTIDVLGYEDEL